jgi:hypothetical protein
MTNNLTDEQRNRCRAAANELRQRAAGLLEDASRLDGWPILHLTIADESRIADALGISLERFHRAVETLMPADDDTEADDLGGTADTPERAE